MNNNPWIAAALNFFLMGAGTFYLGRRQLPRAGVIMFSYLRAIGCINAPRDLSNMSL
jgi:hypothetical protein